MSDNNIFKYDSAGRLRFWRQEIEGNRYRTISGVVGGADVVSGWTTCTGKQGRTDAQQASSRWPRITSTS